MTSSNNTRCPWSSDPYCTQGITYQRNICSALYPHTGNGLTATIAQCILERLTQFEQASLATETYALTLWPAFVGIICGFGPDPSDVVYDSIVWALLFTVTCGALPGLNTVRPPHHMVVETMTEGRDACVAWQYSKQRPRIRARNKMPKQPRKNQALSITEWTMFCINLGLYFGFCIFFALSLEQAYMLDYPSIVAASWYYLAAAPAFGTFLSEFVQDRVDLYEPEGATSTLPEDPQPAEASSKTVSCLTTSMVSYPSAAALAISGPTAAPKRFHPVANVRFFQKWLRVLAHQWKQRPYRLLVRPESRKWPFPVWKVTMALARLAIFATGSVAMGEVMFLPFHNQLILFVLLIFVSALPRFTWLGLWARSPHGADLVVLVKPVDDIDYG